MLPLLFWQRGETCRIHRLNYATICLADTNFSSLFVRRQSMERGILEADFLIKTGGSFSPPSPFSFLLSFLNESRAGLSQGVLNDVEMWKWVPINSELFFVGGSSIYLYRQKVKPVLCIAVVYGIVRKIFFFVVSLWNYPCHPIT